MNSPESPDAAPEQWYDVYARIRLRRVEWSDVRRGQSVYYRIPWMSGVSGTHARGPFTVENPERKQLRNTQGVILTINRIELLVQDSPKFKEPAVAGIDPVPVDFL